VLLLCIMQLLEVAWYTLWDRTCSILYSKDHDTFYLWPIRDLAEFVYKLFPPKWRILTMKTLSYKLKRLTIYSFDQIITTFSPFQSCFIYQCWPCAFICWWCCNLTHWKDKKKKIVMTWLLYRLNIVLSSLIRHDL
jgi:hypothetical protein